MQKPRKITDSDLSYLIRLGFKMWPEYDSLRKKWFLFVEYNGRKKKYSHKPLKSGKVLKAKDWKDEADKTVKYWIGKIK